MDRIGVAPVLTSAVKVERNYKNLSLLQAQPVRFVVRPDKKRLATNLIARKIHRVTKVCVAQKENLFLPQAMVIFVKGQRVH